MIRIGSAIAMFAAVAFSMGITSSVQAQTKRSPSWFAGTYLDPAIQRPDIFPHYLTQSLPEHRQVYNRPRYITGKIAHVIEPSSQEAMAWETNYCNGNYRNHAGRYMPLYMYPKPWEAINTRARPGRPDDMIDETGNARRYGLPSGDTPGAAPVVQEVVEPARL
jgi:hypothetical protein